MRFGSIIGVFVGLLLGADAAQGQPAKNGDRTIATTGVVLNQYTRLAVDAAPGDLSIEVTDVAALASPEPIGGGPLGPGDVVLLYQVRGASVGLTPGPFYGAVDSFAGAGNYELRTVARVVGSRIELEPVDAGGTCAGLRLPFLAAHTQVLRVPSYRRLQVTGSGEIVAAPWDGERGGVVAVMAEELTLDGRISASGRGFRGGPADGNDRPPGSPTPIRYGSDDLPAGGHKGEGIASGPPHLYDGQSFPFSNPGGNFDEAPVANAGGGGGSHGAGGGGGALVAYFDVPTYTLDPWPYDPRLDPIVFALQGDRFPPNPAWAREPMTTDFYWQEPHNGGGRGGYSHASVDLDARSVGPGNVAWGGDWRRKKGGWGGRAIFALPPGSAGFFGGDLFLGGGGGAGSGPGAGSGGAGGGVVFLVAERMHGSGMAEANGARGGDGQGPAAGGGGGGAGGQVRLYVRDPAASSFAGRLEAKGGNGGDHVHGGVESAGPGGGGNGGAVIQFQPLPSTGVGLPVVATGGAGVSHSPSVRDEFPANGATAGNGHGEALVPFTEPLSPDCARLTLRKRILAGDPFFAAGDTIQYRIEVRNEGLSAIEVTGLTDPLLPGMVCQRTLPTVLAPTEGFDCDGSYVVTAADVAAGQVVNEVMLTGRRLGGEAYGPLRTGAIARYQAAGVARLELTKTASIQDGNGSGRAEPGEVVRYTLLARNDGALPLTGVIIHDPMLPSLDCTPGQPANLAPGAQLQCTGEYPVTAADLNPALTLINTATARGRDPGNQELSDQAQAEVPLGLPVARAVPLRTVALVLLLLVPLAALGWLGRRRGFSRAAG